MTVLHSKLTCNAWKLKAASLLLLVVALTGGVATERVSGARSEVYYAETQHRDQKSKYGVVIPSGWRGEVSDLTHLNGTKIHYLDARDTLDRDNDRYLKSVTIATTDIRGLLNIPASLRPKLTDDDIANAWIEFFGRSTLSFKVTSTKKEMVGTVPVYTIEGTYLKKKGLPKSFIEKIYFVSDTSIHSIFGMFEPGIKSNEDKVRSMIASFKLLP